MLTLYRNLTACLAAVSASIAVATLPQLAGTPSAWFVLLGSYGLLSAWALVALARENSLVALLKPKGGDVTLGIVSGLVLVGGAFFALRLLAPNTSPRSAWLFALYAQFGDVQGETLRTAGLLSVVVLEEIVWRGFIQTRCVEAWGPARGLAVTSGLYAAAHLPSLFTLQVQSVGLNPLLPLAALGCGAVWATIVLLTGRVAPAIVCHAVLSYFASAPAPSWLW